LEQSFIGYMPLQMASSAFELGKRCESSSQWCYLHRLRISIPSAN